MPSERKTGRVNVREFIEAQVQGLIESDALAAKIRDSVEGLVMEVLSEQELGGGGGGGPAVLDLGVIRDAVRDELEAQGVSGGGAAVAAGGDGGLSLNEIRKIVAEMIEAVVGDDFESTSVTPPEAVRAVVREEMAAAGMGAGVDMEGIAALVRNEVAGLDVGGGGRGGGGGLDEDAVRAIVQGELIGVPLGGPAGEGGGAGLGEAEVRALVAETLQAEAAALLAKVRESVGKLVAQAHRDLLDGPELAEKLAAAGGGGGGLDEYAVRDLVTAGLNERLPAGGLDSFVTQDEVQALIGAGGGGGGGGGDEGGAGGGGAGGLSPREIKALVKDIVNAEAPTRDEVEKLIRRTAGGGGGGGEGGLSADEVRELVAEALAAAGPAQPAGPSLEDVRALVAAEIAAAGGVGGGDAEVAAGGGLTVEDVRAVVAEEIAASGGTGGDGGGLDASTIRAAIADEVQRAVAASGGGGGGGGGGGAAATVGGIGVEEFLNSDAMKEALEDRFRLMQTYIKTDLVPKLVKKALEDNG